MKRLSRKKSKRVSLRQKHKIVKDASIAKKKLRKEARRMSAAGIQKVGKKDPGIPNLCPQKKELLQELQNQKKIEVEHRQAVRKVVREQRTNEEFVNLRSAETPYKQDNSLEAAITASDLIMEVLDARDPYPYPMLSVLSQSKPHIFVLNKADLVSSEVLLGWQAKLSQISPCFFFQTPVNLSQRQELTEYLKKSGKIIVGVVGYPNTGKSSLINTLKGYKIAPVSKLPGGTKKIDQYEIDETLTVLDCPPIEKDEKTPAGALRCAVGIENLQDPYTPVQGVLEKANKEKLLVLYAIPDFKDIKEFLLHIAKKMGKVSKGRLPDFDAAAKIVLYDWFTMKIPFQSILN